MLEQGYICMFIAAVKTEQKETFEYSPLKPEKLNYKVL